MKNTYWFYKIETNDGQVIKGNFRILYCAGREEAIQEINANFPNCKFINLRKTTMKNYKNGQV